MENDASSEILRSPFETRKKVVRTNIETSQGYGEHLNDNYISNTVEPLQRRRSRRLVRDSLISAIKMPSNCQVSSKLTTLLVDSITAIGSPTDCIPNRVISLPWKQPIAKVRVPDSKPIARRGRKRKLYSVCDTAKKCQVTLSDFKSQLELCIDSYYVKGSSVKVNLSRSQQRTLKLLPVPPQSNAIKPPTDLNDEVHHYIKELHDSSEKNASNMPKETDKNASNILQNGRYENFLENNRYLFSDRKATNKIYSQKTVPCIDLTEDDNEKTENPQSAPMQHDVPMSYVFHCFGCNQSKRFHSKKEVETITGLHLMKFHCIKEPESFIKCVFDKETNTTRFETFPCYKK